MITTAVFDTKPYDREQLQRSSAHSGIEWRFLEFRLTKDTAATAQGARPSASSSMTNWTGPAWRAFRTATSRGTPNASRGSAPPRATGQRVAIMADLPGPKMRVGKIEPEPIQLRPGDAFTLTSEE